MAKELQAEIRTRREKMKNINYSDTSNMKQKKFAQNEKKVSLPEHHFYEEREKLT